MAVPTCITAISDSRGRYLGDYLRKPWVLQLERVVIEHNLGGSGYETLLREVRHHTRQAERQYHKHKILIFGGICDVTTKTNNDIFFIIKDSRVRRIQATLDDIVNFTNQRSFHLALSTVMPVNLAKANNYLESKKNVISSFTNTEIQTQQASLELEKS